MHLADPIEQFALETQVAALDAQLGKTTGLERLGVLVRLAWHLRERDTRRALVLVEEARLLVQATGALDSAERTRIDARLTTTEAAAKVLFAQFDAADVLIGRARNGF